jgi:hypothetical protein
MLSTLYGQLSPLRVPTKAVRKVSDDADANTYLLAVESADGQELESGVITAVETFITGCKSDGIWGAIKASCILAGARTLSGALVPLVGSAPTNNNFVTADYNRETGLLGDGTTKYLNSNRANNADPQNSKHLSVYASQVSLTAQRNAIGAGVSSNNGSVIQLLSSTSYRNRVNSSNPTTAVPATSTSGLVGVSRSNPSNFIFRQGGNNYTATATSAAGINLSTLVFAASISTGPSGFSANRMSFYSLGESIDLAALDTRVSNLMTALAAAIP